MKNKIIGFLGNFLIFCLLVSLVCLAFIYMFSFQASSDFKFNADDMAALEQSFAAAGYMDSVSEDNIMPVFVGVSLAESQMRSGVYGGETLESMYKDCFAVAGRYLAFGSAEEISAARAEDFLLMAKSNGFFYIKYSAAYPKSVLLSFTDKEYFSETVSDEYIREIFVFYNNYTSSVCVLALSGGEKNYLYGGSFGYSENFNNNMAIEYNNAEGTFDFSFASEEAHYSFVTEEKFEKAVYANTVIVKTEIEFPDISFENIGPRLTESGVYEKILSSFTLNPEKVTVFKDSDGTFVYFEEGQSVGIFANGAIEYSSAETGGIDIGSVIGYHAENNEYSLRDKIGASLLIAEKIIEFSGTDGNISVKLSGISHDKAGNLVITYSFSYRGIDIICDTSAFSFTIAGNRITNAKCFLLDVIELDMRSMPSALWQISVYAFSSSETADFCPVYEYSAEEKYASAQYQTCFRGGQALR